MNKHKITIAVLAYLAGFLTLLTSIIIFEIDLVKWANCSAPFAASIDKESRMCR